MQLKRVRDGGPYLWRHFGMKYPQRMQAATTRKAITAKTIENVFPVPESRRVVSRARRGAIELEAASLRLRNVSQQKG